ncbi:MAG: type I methionyl aminopeptidase [Candidatus Actinomarina sp.]|nr:type I methionyl aminopeptidase [Candidatus Actinomarinales bacterium]|tara:strand:+ start:1857 stop:2609 length:753 start_codon:yes stop_codon:yes gene_type:complete
MITYKSSEDFEKMRKAGKVVSNIHYEIFDKTKPGMTLLDLDLIAKEIIERSNVKPSFLGYHDFPAHICASPNDVIVHGIPNEYVISEGDIISVDVGVIFQGYHADAAFSFGVGEITEEEKNLLSKTKYALHEAIKLVKDGQKLGTIGNKIDKIAKKNNLGNVKNYVGHGIGQEMHEEPQVPHYGKKNTGFELRTGMAICIEPMFNLGSEDNYVDEDGWTVKTIDGKKSAHWEHTIGLTQEGTYVFTENLF